MWKMFEKFAHGGSMSTGAVDPIVQTVEERLGEIEAKLSQVDHAAIAEIVAEWPKWKQLLATQGLTGAPAIPEPAAEVGTAVAAAGPAAVETTIESRIAGLEQTLGAISHEAVAGFAAEWPQVKAELEAHGIRLP